MLVPAADCPECGLRVLAPLTTLGPPVRLERDQVIGARWRIDETGTARFTGSGPGKGYALHRCTTPPSTAAGEPSITEMFT